jgi:Cu/Ag efflux protein CusF
MPTAIWSGAGRAAMLLAVCLLLGGCKPAAPVRQYPMHGEVLALDAQNHTATIRHGKIGDWMGAMTMEYPIKNAADWKKLAPGVQIDATVFVSDAGYFVGDVRVAPGSAPPHR